MKNDSPELNKIAQKGRKNKVRKEPKTESSTWEMSAYDALKVNYLNLDR